MADKDVTLIAVPEKNITRVVTTSEKALTIIGERADLIEEDGTFWGDRVNEFIALLKAEGLSYSFKLDK